MSQALHSKKSPVIRFVNAHIYRAGELHEEDLWIRGGKVIAPQNSPHQVRDATGVIISPGFIDIQINGAFGVDFSSEPERVEEAALQLTRFGVTAFCPTLVSSNAEFYRRAIPQLQPRQIPRGASLLGIHLEGPFIHPGRCGAHNQQHIAADDAGWAALKQRYGTLDGVKLITLAPELPQVLESISALKNLGIVVAAGHSQATSQESETAIKAGIQLVTHLFNALSPYHHREPGLIGTALLSKNLHYSLIVDGQHLHPHTIRLAWKANPEGLVLLTDGMAAMGLKPGSYRLSDTEILVDEGAARIKGKSTLAGAICPLDSCLRRFYHITQCSIPELLALVTERPAALLKLSDKGTLNQGADADFVLLDSDLHLLATYVAGEEVYTTLPQSA